MKSVLLLILLLVLPVPVLGHQPGPFHIVMVTWRGMTQAEQGFMDYLEQQHVCVHYTVLDCQKDGTRLPGYVMRIKELHPDLVYVFGTTAALGICGRESTYPDRRFITDIPVVFNIVSVPVKSGLVNSRVSSDRNITGTTHIVPIDTQLRAINALQPLHGLGLGVIYNAQEKNSLLAVEELEKRSSKHGFFLVKGPVPVTPHGMPDRSAISSTVDRLAERGADMVYLPSDSFIVANCRRIVETVNHHGLPTFSATEVPIIKGGALTGLVSRYYNVGRLAGYKARQILVDHRQPAGIPVETLSRFSFMVNMDTARKISYYPPISVLKFAEVVQ